MKARLLNAAVWTAVAVAIIATSCASWKALGCGTCSLIVGSLFYLVCCAILGVITDMHLRDK